MTDISERLVVHCPDHEASRHLAAFVAEHQAGENRVRIALRLPNGLFADRRSLLERRVIATMYPLRSIADEHPTYSVTWSPQGGGPFPEFAGALAVEKSVSDDTLTLIVSGHYDPSHALPGRPADAIDAVLGRRVAQAAARDLLRSIADFVENACAHNEAARAGYYR